MTDKFEVYRAWAPESSPWSAWVKPVLFAHVPAPAWAIEDALPEVPDLSWFDRSPDSALVLDLAGPVAIRLGLSLAMAGGYWPVPTFASIPPDGGQSALIPTMGQILALQSGSDLLNALPPGQPRRPVFLVDSRRGSNAGSPPPGTFDNRSAVFASDLPSATFLRSQGITRCTVVIRDSATGIGEDLIFALLPWKREGIGIEIRCQDGSEATIRWPGKGFIAGILHRLNLLVSLRRNAAGGFGRFVPESSSG